jgi:hypothetical protein
MGQPGSREHHVMLTSSVSTNAQETATWKAIKTKTLKACECDVRKRVCFWRWIRWEPQKTRDHHLFKSKMRADPLNWNFHYRGAVQI